MWLKHGEPLCLIIKIYCKSLLTSVIFEQQWRQGKIHFFEVFPWIPKNKYSDPKVLNTDRTVWAWLMIAETIQVEKSHQALTKSHTQAQNTWISSEVTFQFKKMKNFHCFINVVTFFSFSGAVSEELKRERKSIAHLMDLIKQRWKGNLKQVFCDNFCIVWNQC